MLLIRCANGWVGWVLTQVERGQKVARCVNVGFLIQYSPSRVAGLPLLVRDMVAHSVSLQGAFQDMFQLEL